MNPTVSKLALPGSPDVAVTHQVLEHGRVRYCVRGRRLRGTLVVAPHIPQDGPIGRHLVHVNLGEGTDPVRPYTPRPDEPVVNGVRIHGASELLDPDRIPTVVLASRVSVLLGNFDTRRVPDRARETLEEVAKAVVRHWRGRTDRAHLVQAAERREAARLVGHEQHRLDQLAAKLAETLSQRAEAGRRSRQIAGLSRRRQPPALPVNAAPECLPVTASDGTSLGTLSVRELEVDAHHGRVVYAVSGPRTRGLFTVGPDPYDDDVIPQGLSISYGRSLTDGTSSRPREGMPRINGLTLHGTWRHRGRTPITSTSPPRLTAQVASGDGRYASAPAATSARASAVLRALALHYLARPDLDALRIAAGKQRVAGRRDAVRDELAKLRRTEARQRRALRQHQARRDHFAALADSTTAADESCRIPPPAA